MTVEERTHEPGSNPAEVASSSRIDVHVHCVPQEWQAVPAASAPLFRGLTGWNVPSALEMMDRQGIATAVLSMAFGAGCSPTPMMSPRPGGSPAHSTSN